MSKITYIDEAEINNKKVLLRVDFNLSLNSEHQITDDYRLERTLPTIKKLLADGNKLTIISHLGEPKSYDPSYSLTPVVELLKKFLPEYEILLGNASTLKNQTDKQIFVLENIRFYPQEYSNDEVFAKELAGLCEVYVNDAFSVSHRNHASIVGVTKFIPSYGGLLLKKELEMLDKVITNPQRPFVAIVGGIKEDKVKFAQKLITLADRVLIGSGMIKAFEKGEKIIIPHDVVTEKQEVKKTAELNTDEKALDIGPETEADFGHYIGEAKTIVWSGPMGNFENPAFRRGTDFIYYSITENSEVISIIGGGDTLSALSKKEYLDKITHISTGGGAMLEYIENGTLSGIEALKK